jgi:electron-transferring-flavoprotein dehydrogenase
MEERDVMEVDVLFVGGGVASLSGALHLSNLIKRHNEGVEKGEKGEKIEEPMVAVLEKGAYIGAHNISGAVIDPITLNALVPDFKEKEAPIEAEVAKESLYFLTKKSKIKAPGLFLTLAGMKNHGNYVVSLSRLTEWLGQRVEEAGVDIFPGFAGTEVLFDGDRVKGVRTGDKGIDRDGSKKSNFEPGIDLQARVTVFGEGSRGSLTKTLIKRFRLDEDRNPPGYEVGVKEIWEIPEGRIQPGDVIETMGYPMKSHTFGGGFVYGMKDNHVSLGLLTSLDYSDPYMDPHRELQRFKGHPMVADLLKDGKLVQYGAKTVPVSGYFSVPKLCFEGGLVIGDSACLFNAMKIKGVHMAMRSGMEAAETIYQGLVKNDFSENHLKAYEAAILEGPIGKELYKIRNFHQALEKGLYGGLIKIGFQTILGGRILKNRVGAEPDWTHMKTVHDFYGTDSPDEDTIREIKFDGKQTFDKENDVYFSATTHEEQQPPHLQIPDLNICYTQCKEKYHNPCVRFCPANVYEIVIDEDTGSPSMKLNFSNCVHCKTCDVKDPFDNINWVPPEGGGGPKYTMV